MSASAASFRRIQKAFGHFKKSRPTVCPSDPAALMETVRCATLDADEDLFSKFSFKKPQSPRFHCLNEALSSHKPDTIAYKGTERQVNFDTLEKMSGHLAHILQKAGVGTADQVNIVIAPGSLASMVALIAVLRIGASARLCSKDDQVAPYVLDTTKTDIITEDGSGLVVLDLAKNDLYHQPLPPVQVDGSVAALIDATRRDRRPYIVSHPMLINWCDSAVADLSLSTKSSVSHPGGQHGSTCAWSLLAPIYAGAAVIDPTLEDKSAITHVIAVPNAFLSLNVIDYIRLEVACVIGGRCPHSPHTTRKPFQIIECYSPASPAIFRPAYRPDGCVHGRPSRGSSLYVLDEDLNPKAMGETGMIWIGGESITLSHKANPNHEPVAMQRDIFRSEDYIMYRSQERGHWDQDGNLVFYKDCNMTPVWFSPEI